MIKALLLQFEEYDRRIFWIAIFLFGAALTLYIYFLGVSVYAVIERKSAEQHAQALSSAISTLESQYVVLDKHIDLALAHEQGFVDIAVPTYLSQSGGGKTFSLRTEASQ